VKIFKKDEKEAVPINFMLRSERATEVSLF
jgi:hypothetical protein